MKTFSSFLVKLSQKGLVFIALFWYIVPTTGKMIDISKCKLTKYPAPILKQKALPIESIDEDVASLATAMLDIMFDNNGIGLAAPQANFSLRMFVVSISGEREDAMVFINPKLTLLTSCEIMQEGCLSVPGIYTNIKRATKVKVEAQGLDGKEFTIVADGLLARCIQHEYDHLEGKTIIDRMTTLGKLKHRKEIEAMIDAATEQD